jgi:hypothetical protein
MTRAVLTFLVCAGLLACDRLLPEQRDLALPDIDTVEQVYARHGVTAQYRYSGNVLEVIVQQQADQLRRGGPLWARVGPYIYLFSPGTRQLFDDHAGLAGVRVVTMTGTTEVARAMLVRDELNEFGWRRARNTLAEALESGTERPSTMDRLVQYGEQHTQFEYNPDYVPPR